MRKIAHHLRNVESFGAEHCPRQFEALDYFAYEELCDEELDRCGSLGIRTDWAPGKKPRGSALGLLPFFPYQDNRPDLKKIWWNYIHPRGLAALVCENIPVETVRCNFVTQPIDDQTILVEFSTAPVTQREMYDDGSLLRHFCLGPDSYAIWNDRPVRCFRPRDARIYRFDRVYEFAMMAPRTLTGTVTKNNRLLFW